MIIAGYAVWGFLTILLALTGNLTLAVGFSFGTGIANMVFVIPSQTLFQQRTPSRPAWAASSASGSRSSSGR